MNGRIEWDDGAVRDLRKLGHPAQQQIHDYLRNRIATDEEPHRFGLLLVMTKQAYGVIEWGITVSFADLKMT